MEEAFTFLQLVIYFGTLDCRDSCSSPFLAADCHVGQAANARQRRADRHGGQAANARQRRWPYFGRAATARPRGSNLDLPRPAGCDGRSLVIVFLANPAELHLCLAVVEKAVMSIIQYGHIYMLNTMMRPYADTLIECLVIYAYVL